MEICHISMVQKILELILLLNKFQIDNFLVSGVVVGDLHQRVAQILHLGFRLAVGQEVRAGNGQHDAKDEQCAECAQIGRHTA